MSGRTMWLKRLEDGYELARNGGHSIHTMCMDFEWALGFSMEVGQKQRVRLSVERVGKLIEAPPRAAVLGDIDHTAHPSWRRSFVSPYYHSFTPGESLHSMITQSLNRGAQDLTRRLIDRAIDGRPHRRVADEIIVDDPHDDSFDFYSIDRNQRFAFLYGARGPWPRGGSFGVVRPDRPAEIIPPRSAEIRTDRVPRVVIHGRQYDPDIPEEGDW